MANPRTLQNGTLVGAYTVLETLDVNSHSVLYRARVTETDEEVWLLEFLPVDLAGRQKGDGTVRAREDKTKPFEESLTLFLKEARVLSQIRDPYVARIKEYTETRGTAFMAMDLEQGISLDSYLGQTGKIAEKELRQLFIPLLKGLRVVHSHDLLHRDVNPKNIFIRDAGPPLITGFGSTQRAIAFGDVGLDSRVTPGYSPIEQYHQQSSLGPWTDLYAMGAVLYKCMTGITPVDATKRVTAIAEGNEDPLVPAMEIGHGDYHTTLLSSVDWMLQPVIDRRPHSVGEVLGPLSEPAAKKTPARDRPGAAAESPQGEIRLNGTPRLHADPATRVGPPKRSKSKRKWSWLVPVLFFLGVGAFAFWPQIKSLVPGSKEEHADSRARMEQTGIPQDILDQPLPKDEEPPKLPESLKFGRTEDQIRADEYRKIESLDRSVRVLLEAAAAKAAAGKLIAPPSDNALADYNAVLLLDADNVDARQGIDQVAAELLKQAQAEFDKGSMEGAEALIGEMLEAGLGSEGTASLQTKIDHSREKQAADTERARQEKLAEEERVRAERLAEKQRLEQELAEQERIRQEQRAEAERREKERLAEQERIRQEQQAEAERMRKEELAKAEAERLTQEKLAEQERLVQERQAEEARRQQAQQTRQRIKELLLSATVALEEGTSTESAGSTALSYYREVLELDPDNEDARTGISNVTQYYVDLANQSLAEDRFEDVERELLFISSIDPDNEAVDLLRDQMRVRREVLARAQSDTGERQQTAAPGADGGTMSEVDRFSLEQGVKAYYRGDYQTAYSMLKPLADKGNQRSQFRVGVMYLRGRGVEQDTDLGTAWIRRAFPDIQAAAAEGEAWAQADLGSLYQDGLLVAQNDNEAVRWYMLAAEQGYAGAQTNLGTMYASGRGVNQSRSEAIKWLKRAAEQGDKIARDNLAALGVSSEPARQVEQNEPAKQ